MQTTVTISPVVILAIKPQIKNMQLQGTFAYKIQDNLSVGLGVAASYFTGELTKKGRAVLETGQVIGTNIDATIKGDDTTLAWNLGVVWQPR